MPGPLVTIVTPCFNPGWRLQRCLDSVAAQTYGDVEHLVVDAQSTDGTREVLEGSSSRWLSEPDSGQSDAINKGVRMARGDVVTWLNADDILVPGAVAAAVETFATTGADWVYGDVRIVGDGADRTIRPPDHLSPRHFRVTNPLPQPGTFLTRSAWTTVGDLDESLHYSMDVDLWLRLLRAGKIGRSSGALHAVFEVHDASKGGSVAFADFLFETGLSCLRNGYGAYGAAYLGRTAAHRAADRGELRWAKVLHELEVVLADPRLPAVDAIAAQHSARAQLLLLAARRGHLAPAAAGAASRMWTDPLARALLANAVRLRVGR